MIYSSITLSKSTIYDIVQWIEQYVTHLDDNINFEANTSEKDEEYQSYDEHMHCVAIECVLVRYEYYLDDLFAIID